MTSPPNGGPEPAFYPVRAGNLDQKSGAAQGPNAALPADKVRRPAALCYHRAKVNKLERGPMQELKTRGAPDLFSPIDVGSLTLGNRVVMAPLTRSRAGPGNVPTQLNALYYAQRASAGLIIAEATQVAPEGQGYISTPGIHSADQIAGWKCVTQAVHVAGGPIVCQLWHVGRISHPSFQPGGQPPVALSAIRPDGQAYTAKGFEPIPTPRALELAEIPAIVRPGRPRVPVGGAAAATSGGRPRPAWRGRRRPRGRGHRCPSSAGRWRSPSRGRGT